MATKTILEVSSELYKLLEPFTSEERQRIIQGTITLLGDSMPNLDLSNDIKNELDPNKIGTAQQYFALKKPQSKQEELAVAARYRELKDGAETSTREQFQSVFSAARINFDGDNFSDNIANAKKKTGLFNTSGGKQSGYKLSFYGQNYVDKLPDREAIKQLRKPKVGGKSKRKKLSKKVG